VPSRATTVRTVDDFQAEIWGVGDEEVLVEVNLSIYNTAFRFIAIK
jgi:hypothetical protein